MGYSNMSAGTSENETHQFCTFEEASEKSQSNTNFVQFSPSTTVQDWASWDIVKAENETDSDSSQQIGSYCSEQDANAENTPGCSLNFLDPSSEEVEGRKKKKSKEMPAVNKPAQVVERRNARERRRVQAVNGAFQKLRKVVPIEENKSKRMSKVKTLQLAIEYINQLQNQLQVHTQRSTHPFVEKKLMKLVHPADAALDANERIGSCITELKDLRIDVNNCLELRKENEVPELLVNDTSSALIALDVYADFNPQQQIKLESEFSPFRMTQYYFGEAE